MIEINDIQKDVLREVGNIGVGNAATSLSQLINKRVDISIPQIEIITLTEVINKIGDEETPFIAMLLKVFGDIQGDILFIVDINESERIKTLLNLNISENDELIISMFQEIANILGNSFLNALVRLLNINAVTTVPGFTVDMLSSIIISSFMDAEQYDDNVIMIDNNFYIEGNEIITKFMYIPKEGDMEKILERALHGMRE